eukprot:1136798-Pelagomonas_calceolata.AAC.2
MAAVTKRAGVEMCSDLVPSFSLPSALLCAGASQAAATKRAVDAGDGRGESASLGAGAYSWGAAYPRGHICMTRELEAILHAACMLHIMRKLMITAQQVGCDPPDHRKGTEIVLPLHVFATDVTRSAPNISLNEMNCAQPPLHTLYTVHLMGWIHHWHLYLTSPKVVDHINTCML